MKKIVLCFFMGALSLSAVAQAPEEVESVTITDSNLRITVPNNLYKMRPDEFYNFKGAYSLSNGQTLWLYDRGRRMFAQLDHQEGHQIVATGENAFVALDKQLKMRIDLHNNGDVSGELYMIVPAQKQANGSIGKEQMILIAFR